ncbi:PTS sugar transporter subunit IIA [Verrucomicrobiota bacterium]
MKLTDLLKEQRIVLDVDAKTKEGIIGKLVDPVVNGHDRQTVLDAILEREKLGSTGIGHGVAVPHVRLDAVDAAEVVFGRSTRPIDFEAIDEEPCSLFFLVLGPTRQDAQEEYLQTMAKISRLMRNADIRDALASASTPVDALAVIAANES